MLSKLRFIFGVLLMGALAACSSPKVDQNTAARRDLDNSGAQTSAQTGAIGADRGQEAAPDPLNDPNSPLAQRSIYYGFNRYDLALGQKRAEAVRRALALMGVNGEQMEAVSLGKEKPQAFGHDEAAWSQNRRADIVYQ